jgi:hypothetical protein
MMLYHFIKFPWYEMIIIIIYDLSSPIEKNKEELSLFSRFFFFGRQIDLR